MENIELAFLLIVVGMTTVFSILLIVIYFGKTLIYLVNKYIPEKEKSTKEQDCASTKSASITSEDSEAISKAIEMITNGIGKVIKIEKI